MFEKLAREIAQGGGWNMLEKAGQNFQADMAQQRADLMAQAADLAAPFRTAAGEKALLMLLKATWARPLAKPIEGYTLEQQALYAARREGQNEIVAMILNAIDIARGEAPSQPERKS